MATWALGLAFLGAAVLGAVMSREGHPLATGVVVLGFALIVLIARTAGSGLAVLQTPAAQDSPYFLGFVLTLFKLYDSLSALERQSELDAAAFLGAVAASLIPTGVGLLSRQFLSVLGDSQAEHVEQATNKALVTSAADVSLLRNDVQHIRSELVALNATFGDLQLLLERSLERDEDVLGKVMGKLALELERLRDDALFAQLRAANGELALSISAFAAARRDALVRDKQAAEAWRKIVEDLVPRLEGPTQSLEKTANSASSAVGELARSLGSATTVFDALPGHIAKLSQDIEQPLKNVSEGLGTSGRAIADHARAVTSLAAQTKSAAGEITLFSQEVGKASGAMRSTATLTAGIPHQLELTVAGVRAAHTDLDNAVKRYVDPVHRDAKEINEILRDLTEILTERVSTLRKLRDGP